MCQLTLGHVQERCRQPPLGICPVPGSPSCLILQVTVTDEAQGTQGFAVLWGWLHPNTRHVLGEKNWGAQSPEIVSTTSTRSFQLWPGWSVTLSLLSALPSSPARFPCLLCTLIKSLVNATYCSDVLSFPLESGATGILSKTGAGHLSKVSPLRSVT